MTAIVDAAGPAVAAALAAAPDLVTPNLAEAEAALGRGDGAEPVDVPPDARPRAESAAAALCAARRPGGARHRGGGRRGARDRRRRRDLAGGARRGASATRSAPATRCSPGSRPRSSAACRWPRAARAGVAAAGRLRRGRARGPARRRARRGAAGADAVTLLLGLDVGTTSCKAAVFDAGGEELVARPRADARGGASRPARRPTRARCSPPRSRPARPRSPARPRRGGGRRGREHGRGRRAARPRRRAARPADRLVRRARRGGGGRARAPTSARTRSRPGPACRSARCTARSSTAGSSITSPATARAVRRLNVAEWIVRGLGGDEQTEWSLASRTGWLDLARARLVGRGAGLVGRRRGRCSRRSRSPGRPPAAPAARSPAPRRGPRDRRPRPPQRRGRRRRGRRGDVLDSCGTAETLIRASAPLPPERVRERSRAGSTSAGTPCRPPLPARLDPLRRGARARHGAARRGAGGARRARGGGARGARRRRRDRGDRHRRAGVRDHRRRRRAPRPGSSGARRSRRPGAAAADVLATMDALAGPAQPARRRRRLGRRRGRARGQARAPRPVQRRRLGVRGRARRGAHRGPRRGAWSRRSDGARAATNCGIEGGCRCGPPSAIRTVSAERATDRGHDGLAGTGSAFRRVLLPQSDKAAATQRIARQGDVALRTATRSRTLRKCRS